MQELNDPHYTQETNQRQPTTDLRFRQIFALCVTSFKAGGWLGGHWPNMLVHSCMNSVLSRLPSWFWSNTMSSSNSIRCFSTPPFLRLSSAAQSPSPLSASPILAFGSSAQPHSRLSFSTFPVSASPAQLPSPLSLWWTISSLMSTSLSHVLWPSPNTLTIQYCSEGQQCQDQPQLMTIVSPPLSRKKANIIFCIFCIFVYDS